MYTYRINALIEKQPPSCQNVLGLLKKALYSPDFNIVAIYRLTGPGIKTDICHRRTNSNPGNEHVAKCNDVRGFKDFTRNASKIRTNTGITDAGSYADFVEQRTKEFKKSY
jgi:hypothetical protein